MNREGLKVQVPTLVELTRSRVRCPGCGEEVLAVVSDGRVRGYCTVAGCYVNFLAETQRIDNPTPETAEISASGPDPDEVVRDYLSGVRTVVIQDRYGISRGVCTASCVVPVLN